MKEKEEEVDYKDTDKEKTLHIQRVRDLLRAINYRLPPHTRAHSPRGRSLRGSEDGPRPSSVVCKILGD